MVKTTLTEHFFRWGFCEKFLSQGLSAALKTAIKLPSRHEFEFEKRAEQQKVSFTSNQVAENDMSKENQKYNLLIEACNDSPLTLDSLC